jgi:hypothetical protein
MPRKNTRVTVVCQRCGRDYTVQLWKAKAGKAKYCSQTCYRPPAATVERMCAACGVLIVRPVYNAKRNTTDRFYCTRSCYLADMKGERNFHWKGGRFISGEDGYVMVRVDGRYEFEHRLIMEQHLGRKLTTDEVVHHKNMVVTDNRIENLVVMDNNTHLQMHRRLSHSHG